MKELMIKFTNISIQVLIIGVIGFCWTYFGDYLQEINMFGDTVCNNTTEHTHDWSGYCKGNKVFWGARHYWYNWTLAIITTLQVIRLIVYSIGLFNN